MKKRWIGGIVVGVVGLSTLLLAGVGYILDPDSEFFDYSRITNPWLRTDSIIVQAIYIDTALADSALVTRAYIDARVGGTGDTIELRVIKGRGDTLYVWSDGLFKTVATSVSMGSDRNVATGLWSFVAGDTNIASGNFATVSGGDFNTASEFLSTVGGGGSNIASGDGSTVGGGGGNIASGTESTVGGGKLNTASGTSSTVGGGAGNIASGFRATVPGGQGNLAQAPWSFAAGLGAIVYGDAGDSASMVFGTGVVDSVPHAVLFGNSIGDTVASGHTFMVSLGTVDFSGNQIMRSASIFQYSLGYHLGADTVVIGTDTIPIPEIGYSFVDTSGGDTLKIFLNAAWEAK